MRFVIYGAGAVGGVLGARLHQHGHEAVLIARGPHLEAIRRRGLRLESAEGAQLVDVRAAAHPRDAGIGTGDVVLLTMKTQDTAAALAELVACAPPDAPVACVQNGVENERLALRMFANVYGVAVVCPAGHLHPGVVESHSSPVPGILDVGRHPHGSDETAQAVAAAFRDAGFMAEARTDIGRWKHGKLLANLANAVEAVCGLEHRTGPLTEAAREEGAACLRAAGIDWADPTADPRFERLGRGGRSGGSSWQSLTRGAGSVETDWLNGEIVLLGRVHGIPTPVNAVLQRLAAERAREGGGPGSMAPEAVMALAMSDGVSGGRSR